MLALAAGLFVEGTLEAGVFTANVTTKNIGPGHAIPTGEPLFAYSSGRSPVQWRQSARNRRASDPRLWGLHRHENRRGKLDQLPQAEIGQRLRVLQEGPDYIEYAGFGPFGDGQFDHRTKRSA